MPVKTEKNRLSDSVKHEADGGRSREEVVILAGSGSDRVMEVGTLIGKRTKTTVIDLADAGNTGDGGLGSVSIGTKAMPGVYIARCVEAAANAGIFELISPDGYIIGRINVGVAFTSDHVNMTIADGAADFIVGDKFTVTVSGDGKVVELKPPVSAVGHIELADNPAADDTITLNGTVVTFKASGAVGSQINIGDDVLATLDNMLTFLSGSADAQIAKNTYSNDKYSKIEIVNKTPGTGGNAYTLVKSGANLAVSAATLTGGAGSAVDGSQEAYGVIGDNVIAPDGADKNSFAIVRDAVLSTRGIIWATGVVQADKDKAIAELEDRGIIVRDAA